MTKLNYSITSTVYDENDIIPIFKTKFLEQFKERKLSSLVSKEKLVANVPFNGLIELIEGSLREIAPGETFSFNRLSVSHSDFVTTLTDGGQDVLIVHVAVINQNGDDDYHHASSIIETITHSDSWLNDEVLLIVLDVRGRDKLVTGFTDVFKRKLLAVQQEKKTALVSWVFSNRNEARQRTFQLKKVNELQDEFYPWIVSGLRAYYEAFLNSTSQVLVLYGPPGTGKTSFIRDMLCELNLNSYISYDMNILTADSTFVNYVTDNIFDAIVIEDADDLLTADRADQNKVIAKILNVSDGLIKLPRKKLIFSTNLSNISDIDPAIIRPGRCFDIMHFRELAYTEALDVAKLIGVTLTDNKPYTLADLFFIKDMQCSTDPFAKSHGEEIKKKIGFV